MCKCDSVPWPEPSPGYKLEEKGRGTVSIEGITLSGSHRSPRPLTHLQEDQAAALTSIPEKYLEQDDLVILKLFQTALKEQSLGQPMGGMNGIQFPAGKGPTVSGSDPCGPANIYRSLPLRSHVTMVKAFGRKGGGQEYV